MKKGSYIIIKEQPCKVDHVSTSKPGKHGSAKCHVTAINIFTGKKHEEIAPSHATIKTPIVKRKEYQVTFLDGDFINMLDDNNEEKSDLRLPEGELGKKIVELMDADKTVIVTVLSAMGKEAVIDAKAENE